MRAPVQVAGLGFLKSLLLEQEKEAKLQHMQIRF